MLRSIHDYKIDIHKTFEASAELYNAALAKTPGHISLRVLPPCDIAFYTNVNLLAYDFERDIDRYAEDLLGELAKSYDDRKRIDDNMIPTIFPLLGIGDYAAFVSGEIIFKNDTSWSTPFLMNLSDWKNIPPIGTSKWYRRFLAICEALLVRSSGTGIPLMRGFFSPLDLAHALRGEDIYYDMYDDPDGLHELLDYCADATIRFAEDIYALVRKHLGDTPYGMWYADHKINMSEDIACMISGEAYRTFCAPHTQKVIDHFGVGYMHCHSRAMYLVKEICSLRNVAHLWLATDPNQPRPIEHIDELVRDANGVCLAIDCNRFAEIEDNIEKLRRGNFSICLPCDSVEEGITLVERFNQL